MLHLRCSVGQMVARGRGTDLALQHCSTPFPLCEMFRRLEKAFARLGIYLVYLWLLGLLSPKETRLFCLKKKKKILHWYINVFMQLSGWQLHLPQAMLSTRQKQMAWVSLDIYWGREKKGLGSLSFRLCQIHTKQGTLDIWLEFQNVRNRPVLDSALWFSRGV